MCFSTMIVRGFPPSRISAHIVVERNKKVNNLARKEAPSPVPPTFSQIKVRQEPFWSLGDVFFKERLKRFILNKSYKIWSDKKG